MAKKLIDEFGKKSLWAKIKLKLFGVWKKLIGVPNQFIWGTIQFIKG